MHGKIVGFVNGLPEKVEFVLSKIPNTTFAVIYDYVTERSFPPYSIKGYRTTNEGTKQLWEFLLPEIEAGDLASGFNGFSPTNFLSADQIKSATRSIRNGEKVTYIAPDGKTIEQKPKVPNYNSLTTYEISPNKVWKVRLAMLSFMGLTFMLFIYFCFRRNK